MMIKDATSLLLEIPEEAIEITVTAYIDGVPVEYEPGNGTKNLRKGKQCITE